MPLIKSASDKAREVNIAKEISIGREPKQAVAIGYSVQREAKKKMDNKAPSAKPMRKTGRGR